MNVVVEWLPLAPALVPAAGVLLVLLVDILARDARTAVRWVGILVLAASAAATVPGILSSVTAPAVSLCLPDAAGSGCLWSAGPAASTLQLGILGACAAVLVLGLGHAGEPLRDGVVEVVLVLAAAAGGAGVVAARDLAAWLVLLELATLPTVALVALRGSVRAAAGALSLLTTSVVSFAFLILGAALWLLAGGSPLLDAASAAAADGPRRQLLLLAVMALIAGLAFKLSAVPFHAWTPPAYTGASTPVAALLATASKLTAVGALIAVLAPLAPLVGSAEAPHAVAAVVAVLAVLSMFVGPLVMLRVADSVRFLAFSTIGQAGWVLLPLAALTRHGHRAAVGYALTYAAATVVAFAAVAALGRADDAGRPLAAYRGTLRTRPVAGGALALALVVLAGLPPGVVGLLAKVQALRPVVDAGLWPLAVLAIVAVVIGIAAYLRWFAILIAAPEGDAATGHRVAQPSPLGARTVLVAGGALLLVTSVLPQVLWGRLG